MRGCGQLEKALLTRENRGNGTEDNPYRWAIHVHDPKTLETLFIYDEYEIEELRRAAAKGKL